MENLSYKLLLQRQASEKMVYGVLCILLLVGIAGYSYLQWNKLVIVKTGIETDKATLETLTKTLTDEKNAYFTGKSGFDEMNKTIDISAAEILPRGDKYTDLTRQIDGIEKELSKSGSFEISNIDFGAPVLDKSEFGILPVRMNIKSSQDNFTKFLNMIQTSGSFSNKLRLMSISSIRLNFENGDSADGMVASTSSKMITFSLQLNAYFQK
jgi:hypothetical protein